VSKENKSDQDKEKADSGEDNRSLVTCVAFCIAAAWAFLGLLLVVIFWPNFPKE